MAASEKDIEETMKLFNQNAANLFKTSAEAKSLFFSTNSMSNQPKVETSNAVPVKAELKQVFPAGRVSPATVSTARKQYTNVEGSLKPVSRLAGSTTPVRWPPAKISSSDVSSFSNEQSHAKSDAVEVVEVDKSAVGSLTLKKTAVVTGALDCAKNFDSENTEQKVHKSTLQEADGQVSNRSESSKTMKRSTDDTVAVNDLSESLHLTSDSTKCDDCIAESHTHFKEVLSCFENGNVQVNERINANVKNALNSTLLDPGYVQCNDSSASNSKLNAHTDISSVSSVSNQSPSQNQREALANVTRGKADKKDDVSSTVGDLVECKEIAVSSPEVSRIDAEAGIVSQAVGTVAVLRAISVRRKASAIVSFTTEDFDLFHSKWNKLYANAFTYFFIFLLSSVSIASYK